MSFHFRIPFFGIVGGGGRRSPVWVSASGGLGSTRGVAVCSFLKHSIVGSGEFGPRDFGQGGDVSPVKSIVEVRGVIPCVPLAEDVFRQYRYRGCGRIFFSEWAQEKGRAGSGLDLRKRPRAGLINGAPCCAFAAMWKEGAGGQNVLPRIQECTLGSPPSVFATILKTSCERGIFSPVLISIGESDHELAEILRHPVLGAEDRCEFRGRFEAIQIICGG